MSYRPHPKRARTNPRSPEAWATSDYSGAIGNHIDMGWQFDWTGPRLYNKRFLVFKDEMDKPQEQFRSLVLPPDPVPIMNARPEPYSIDEAGPQTTLLVANALIGATTLFVQSVTGFSNGQSVIVYLDNGGFLNETLNAVDAVANSMGVDVPLPSQASINQIVSAVG